MDEEKPRIKKPSLQLPQTVEKCWKQVSSFKKLVSHLETDHNLKLHSGIDLCHCCESIFQTTKDALLHYLRKAILYENQTITNEMDCGEDCQACKNHFENIKKAIHHFQLEINFEDAMSSNKDKILEFLLEDETTDVEDKNVTETPANMSEVEAEGNRSKSRAEKRRNVEDEDFGVSKCPKN